MKDAGKHMSEILARIRRYGAILMLDFDGTLSPIVANYRHARISPAARAALKRLALRMPVVIISGRALDDVARRVRLDGVAYIGSHGLERMVRGRLLRFPVSQANKRAFAAARRSLRDAARRFGRLPIEDKEMSFAVHYRRLSSARRRIFKENSRRVLGPYARKNGIRIIDHKLTFDIMPDVGTTKGTASEDVYRALSKGRGRPLPVYIGDGETDEDAFRALRRGITIRAGRRAGSAARYFFRARRDVDVFLTRLARAVSQP